MRRNMKKKRFIRIIILIVVLFVLLLIIPWLLNIAYKFDFGIWSIESEWTAGDAIAFYGSVLSGVFTLLGVVLTILYEAKERRNDETIKYKPILEVVGIDLPVTCGYREVGLGYGISGSANDTDFEKKAEIFFNRQRENNPKYRLALKNVGRGETHNAVLENCSVKNVNWEDISHLHSSFSQGQYIGEIIKDGFFEIYVNLPDYLILPKELDNQKYYLISMEMNIDYSDMFNRIRYRYSITIHQKLHMESIESESPNILDSTYCYAKVRYDAPEIMPCKMIYSSIQKKFIHEKEYINEKK